MKILIAAGLVVLAASAVLASTASAEWLVEGKPLGSGKSAALASATTVDQSLILHFTAGTVKILILCAAVSVNKGRIFAPNGVFVQSIDFSSCHTISPTPTNCQLTGEQSAQLTLIGTNPVLATAKSSTRISFNPQTGKLFVNIPFAEGKTCAVEGLIPAKGEVITSTPSGGTETVSQGLQGLGSEENNSLEIGSGNKGFLLGLTLIKLESGKTWSFK
jgi:hypothetical protein